MPTHNKLRPKRRSKLSAARSHREHFILAAIIPLTRRRVSQSDFSLPDRVK